MVDSEGAGIVKRVRDDAVEVFRQFNCRFDPHTALTKAHHLKAIQKFPEKKSEEERACAGRSGEVRRYAPQPPRGLRVGGAIGRREMGEFQGAHPVGPRADNKGRHHVLQHEGGRTVRS